MILTKLEQLDQNGRSSKVFIFRSGAKMQRRLLIGRFDKLTIDEYLNALDINGRKVGIKLYVRKMRCTGIQFRI